MEARNTLTKDLMYITGNKEGETTLKYYIKARAETIEKWINLESQKLNLRHKIHYIA